MYSAWLSKCATEPRPSGSGFKPRPVRSLFHHNRLGQPVLRRPPIRMNEELHESEAEFQRRRAISQCAFDRMPQRHALMDQRHYPDAEQPLPRRASIPEESEKPEIHHWEHEVHQDFAPFILAADNVGPALGDIG